MNPCQETKSFPGGFLLTIPASGRVSRNYLALNMRK
jgi:hypothetical protein